MDEHAVLETLFKLVLSGVGAGALWYLRQMVERMDDLRVEVHGLKTVISGPMGLVGRQDRAEERLEDIADRVARLEGLRA